MSSLCHYPGEPAFLPGARRVPGSLERGIGDPETLSLSILSRPFRCRTQKGQSHHSRTAFWQEPQAEDLLGEIRRFPLAVPHAISFFMIFLKRVLLIW